MRAWPLFLAVLAAGCGGEGGRGGDAGLPDDAPPAVLPEACAALTGAAVIRTAPHLGAGHEVIVRLELPAPPGPADLRECLRVAAREGAPIATAAVRRAVTAFHTLLLVDPGTDRAEAARARAFVDDLLRRRRGDRVGVFRWGAATTQVIPVDVRRPRSAALLDAALVPTGVEPQPLADAVQVAASALRAVGNAAAPALHTIVVVSPRAALDEAAVAAARPHLVLSAGTAADAAQVSGAIDAWAANGFYGVGLCAGPAAREARLRAGAHEALLPIPAALPENEEGACDPAAVAAGTRSFPRRMQLLFTEEERRHADAIYERRWDPMAPGPATEDFPLKIQVSPQHRPVAAEAHWRGQGSFGCDRRNLSIDLPGKVPRFLLPGSAASKFHLISLCQDRLYLRNHTTLSLMAEEALFPVPFGYVELAIDGRQQGVYLLTENVTDAIRRSASGVTAVVRRIQVNYLPQPEVKWALGGDEAGLAAYRRLLEGLEALEGEALERTLRDRLDLDQYLQWLALMVLLGSGDYTDEVFFYAVATSGADGRPREHWSIIGWDQDDLLADCHTDRPLPDPHGLLVCAEADLDRLIAREPRLYAQYVDQLERLGGTLTPERFASALMATSGRLLEHLTRPEVLAGAIEVPLWVPDAGDSGIRAVLNAEVEDLVKRFTANRDRLMIALRRYRDGTGLSTP